jgi:hypothetical protein
VDHKVLIFIINKSVERDEYGMECLRRTGGIPNGLKSPQVETYTTFGRVHSWLLLLFSMFSTPRSSKLVLLPHQIQNGIVQVRIPGQPIAVIFSFGTRPWFNCMFSHKSSFNIIFYRIRKDNLAVFIFPHEFEAKEEFPLARFFIFARSNKLIKQSTVGWSDKS